MSNIEGVKQNKEQEIRIEDLLHHSIFLVPCSMFHGAEDRARTGHLDLGKVALYQMSYFRGFIYKSFKGWQI
jgi:hypothetical protein